MHDHHSPDLTRVNMSFMLAVAANLTFTIVEAIYGVLSGSASLLGDAGHNFSDVLSLLLAWGAAYLATLKSRADYSYGYRKTTILAALLNALVLVLAAGFIVYESVTRFFHPEPIASVTVMIVAGIGILVNGGTAMLFIKGSQRDLNLKGAYLHLASDALVSLGVVLAAILIYFTDMLWIDPLVGLLIVSVIIWGAWKLLKESVSLILDAVPTGIERASVKRFLEKMDSVTEVHDLHIWGMSTHETCLTAHLVMPENTLWDSEDGYARLSQQLLEKFNIHHVTLQVEKSAHCGHQSCDHQDNN